MIERIASKSEMRSAVSAARREGKTVGLVPTMGALHEGHLSLVHAARQRTDVVVVSIFVNPLQFGPSEDFERYPRDIEADLSLLAAESVEIVFAPSVEEMYASDFEITIDPGSLATRWEGEIRPGHFKGAATVVAKLLNIVRPDLAFFGEKDFQQLRVVSRMADDLDLGVRIIGCPIVRDSSGLALSSRNAYLTAEQRSAALALPEALEAAAAALAWGERDPRALEALMAETVERVGGGDVTLEYGAIVDALTLAPAEAPVLTARALLAARVGATRLIDNCELTAPIPTTT